MQKVITQVCTRILHQVLYDYMRCLGPDGSAIILPAQNGAIMIGIALGTVAQSFRIITGREKSILGD